MPPLILDLALYQGDWPSSGPGWYPMNMRLVGYKSWSERFGEEKPLFPLSGFEYRIVHLLA